MVFSSPVFLFAFLPCVLLLFALVPRTLRTPLLFAASLLFYAWGETVYVAYLVVSVFANHALGLLLGRAASVRGRKGVLATGVVLNLAALAWFKYAGFLGANANALLAALGLPALPAVAPHLPIGISFITFEAISYLMDVYRGAIAPQRNPIHVGFFMSFFPHLIAGPVLRFANVAGPLHRPTVTLERFASGVERFTLGLAKKVLVANTVARAADAAFELPPGGLTLGAAWVGVVCYTIQIYFDFSGYTDMAIGLGRMFGFELPRNFDRPYAAISIRDFWRRWHITLSTWFRDYLYIPMGGNRVSRARQIANLFTVFLLCGLWHGASWNFVAWGAFHGAFLAFERLRFGDAVAALPRPLRHAYAMAVVMAGWVFFRSETMAQAWSVLRALTGFGVARASLDGSWWNLVDPATGLAVALAIPRAVLPVAAWQEAIRARLAPRRVRLFAWELAGAAACSLLFVASVASLASGTYNPFIYFRF
jgi:alginate O-acetyltransferase complex protein AlgI